MNNGMDDPLRNFAAFVSATPPKQASDAAYTPLDKPLAGTIANHPEAFTAHGVSVDDLGSFVHPRGISSQIPTDLAVVGSEIVAHARGRNGYGLQGPGTPELTIGAPQQGPKLDQLGFVRLGIGPAIPVVLLAAVLGVWLWINGGRRAVMA